MTKITVGLSILTASLLANTVVDLSAISVTATRTQESVVGQALSISTKSEDEIKVDQVILQKDLLNSLSGVRVEQTGSVIGHMTSVRMPINTSPYYLFMQDDIPVQSGGFFNHNGLAYTTFQSASSVEVLKGAGTALYGSDAVAAVINVKSLAKPSKEKEISLKGMVGSDGFVSGSAGVSDTIDENNAYRANVGYMLSDGWRDHSKADRLEANVRYDHAINSENDVKVIFNASKSDAEQADSFRNEENVKNGSTDASDNAGYFAALEKTDVSRKFDYSRLSAEFNNYSYDNLEISLTPYVRYNRNRYVATWTPNLASNDNKIYTFGLMQKNTYDASWGRLIAGFDSEYTQSTLLYNQDFDLSSRGKNYTAGALYDYGVTYMAIAPYVHSEFDLTKTLRLNAGLRYDYNHYDYKNNLGDNSYDASGVFYRAADASDGFSHLSPKLSLSYKPQSDANFYVRYANGFRIPQASTLYSTQAGYESVEINPETSNTYEIGAKKEFSKKSYVELAAYYMTIDDTITRYANAVTGDYYYDNGGSTIHQGVEATLKSQLSEDFGTKLAYSYSKHNYKNDPTYGNNEMEQAPNHLGNARLIYAPSYAQGLTIMGEYQYTGSWWMDNDHLVDRYKGYGLGNLKVDYVYNKSVRVFGKIANVTDERYAVMANYSYGHGNYTPGDPRQFYAGLEYKW